MQTSPRRTGWGRPQATQAIDPTRRKHPREQVFFRTAGPDAGSCAACHNQPVVGGAGDFVTNVFTSEGFESADFDSLDPQFSNERGSNHLFGAGLVEMLAREMSRELQSIRSRTLAQARADGAVVRRKLEAKGVDFGFITAEPDGSVNLDELDGIDTDLVIRPFSQKGVMTSLRQFTVNAMKPSPWAYSPTSVSARAGPGRMITTATGNRTRCPRPMSPRWWPGRRRCRLRCRWFRKWMAGPRAAARGEDRFSDFGCATCHRPALPLDSLAFADPGPFDLAGTLNDSQVGQKALYDFTLLDWTSRLPRDAEGRVLVPLFGDLKRHVMTDNQIDALGNELLYARDSSSEKPLSRPRNDEGVGCQPPIWPSQTTSPTLDGKSFSAHSGAVPCSHRNAYAAAGRARTSPALIEFLKDPGDRYP